MANKSLFQSHRGALLPTADTVNEAGGRAFALGPAHALAQLAATGCLSGTFYASAESQLEVALALAAEVDVELLAKCAVYARQRGHMKDMPAVLLAVLSLRDPTRFAAVFDRVIDNGRMLRTFVQVMRSGRAGRKSLGTRPKKLITRWLGARSDAYLFRQSVGNAPSLTDIAKMVHPSPADPSRRALWGYLMDKPHDAGALPELVRRFEAFKADTSQPVPDVPFQMLTSLSLSAAHWREIARRASWQTTRMNLNTFARYGVFEDEGLTAELAARLADPARIAEAGALPYQLLVAFLHARPSIPAIVTEALQDAMEHAIANVPVIDGQVWVFPDVSGSMCSPVTGYRKGASSKVRCVDVAALFTAAILRRNPRARVLPFEHRVVEVALNPRDSVMTNAAALARVGGGGTCVSAPLARLNETGARADLVVFVSDNQSWVDPAQHRSTETMREWEALRRRCPGARMVCIDVQPYAHTQAPDREDVLNVGGFSDQVFDVVARFAASGGRAHWLDLIREVAL